MIGNELWCNTAKRLAIQGDISSGNPVEVLFEPVKGDKASLEIRLFIQWFPVEKVLRKWAKVRPSPDSSLILNEVILDCLSLSDGLEFNPKPSYGIKPGQSYPAFFKGFFAGIEFPVASTRLEDGKLVLAHRPGVKLAVGQWFETHKAVFGFCPEGQEKATFFEYLALQRPANKGFHINYNNWWTSPMPFTENDILGLMQTLKENLFDKHGVSFDSFCFDMGWSNDHSIWEIDSKLFPEGFSRLSDLAARTGTSLGLWTSPGGCYDQALNNKWAQANGYEAAVSILTEFDNLKIDYVCLGGEKYRNEFLKNIVETVKTYQIKQIKLDGLLLECSQEDHGHEPGEYSSEAIAKGTISVLNAIRQAMPDIWMESTCFGWNPSPWWLDYVDSTIGAYGTDAPYGRIPCPVFRESYTTARDFFNLQGAARIPIPISAQEVLGIVHQTPDCFMNDAVMTVMRGHSFLPVYVNPKFMDEKRWERLAGILKWTRAHPLITQKTEALLPAAWTKGLCPRFSNDAPMPREPYGYAHWNIEDGKSLVTLRNPWIKPCAYPLQLPISSKGPTGNETLQVVGVYPEPRIYGQNVAPGDMMAIPLAPYETIVLSIGTKLPGSHVVFEPREKHTPLRVDDLNHSLVSKNGKESKAVLARGDSELNFEVPDHFKLDLDFTIEVQAPQADILIVMEGESTIPQPAPSVMVDGVDRTVLCIRSEDGWAVSMIPAVEHWLILKTPISIGNHKVIITTAVSPTVTQVSAWAWASKPGQMVHVDDVDILPQPELISLDAVVLIEPLKIGE